MDSQSPITFNGDSPLHVAVRQGQIEDVRTILIQQQVDVNILNSKHETPLHLACSKGDSAIVQLLIAFGADPYIKDCNSNTAYMSVISHNIGILMDGLLNHCTIWINGPTLSSSSNSLLHAAVRLGELENVQRILEQHFDSVNEVNPLNETPLHLACALGHKQIVHLLMSNGADMYTRDCCNNAPIHRAVSKGHLDIMNSLIITFLCDPKLKGYQGRTLLHFACGVGNVDLVNTLIKKYCISPMATDAVNQTPLHVAASHGQEEIVCLLITKYNHPVEHKTNSSFTPLHLACFCGHLNTVRTLLTKHSADLEACSDNGKSIHQAAVGGHIDILLMLVSDFSCSSHTKDNDGRTILHYACCNGSTELSKFLITDFNLDPLIADNRGSTPLHMACWCGHEELARLLITKYNCPFDVKNEREGTPLHTACLSGSLSIVKMLLSEYKANLYALNHQNNTPLHLAALAGRTDTIKTLVIEFGCDPQVKGFKGRSLLHHACEKGHTNLAMILITDLKLDPLSVDDSGNTPLHMACLSGSLSVVKMLLSEYKANLHALNHQNDTPLHFAALAGQTDTIKTLVIEFGCDPQIKGFKGRSLLHRACEKGHTNLAIILITDLKLDPLSVDDSGNTPLHMACWGGHEELARLLITKYNCPVDKMEETPLHTACSSGNLSVVKMLPSEYKANLHALNHQNDTPLHLAALTGQTDTIKMLVIEFGCDPQVKGFKGRSLLHHACDKGHTNLAMILITDFKLDPLSVDDSGNTPLHMACWCGHEEVARLFITKYNCPVNIKNKKKTTPLHLTCYFGHLNVVRMLVLEFKADINAKDYQNSTPLGTAALGGHVDIVQMLISEFGCSPNVKGFEGQSLLHYACSKGNLLTAKALIKECPLLIHSTNSYGNSPLHFSSLLGWAKQVRLLLFEYHAPVFIRNKAGKTALDLAKDESIKKIFKEYISSEHKSIQQEYEKLQTLSLKKYSGNQIITRVFVIGNPGSGKSTLIESLKRKGVISSRLLVSQEDVPPHTAGIVPSLYQSKKTGRLLYYDFAGDGEYYSSHGAILEMVSHSTVGTNVYVIVANLTKDGMTLCNEIGYWLTFISYHAMNVDSQHALKVVVVLSHSDCLTLADSTNRLNSIKQYLRNQKDNCNMQKLSIIDILSSDCRRPRSSQVIEDTLQQISRDTPPYNISFETSLLHGLLQKDFGNVVACKLHDLLIHIKDTGIYLPTVAKELYPLVKELHEIGVLMMIGQNKDQCENHFLLLDPSSLTNEVHQRLFSDSARQKFNSSVSPYYANMGIIPESYLTSILPEHITKECLIQLQYCQEFSHAEVGLNYLVTPDDALNDHLLYFPVLCKLESEQSDWPTDPKLTFSIGWYTKCTGKFDYFPARYLHVLLLRLAFTFALPIASCNITESNQVSAHNRRCTMWKNGIRWLMEEGVECIFEVVNDNKGIVIIMKSEEHSKEWAIILSKIIDKAMQAKAEFCDSVSLRHFLLNSNDTLSFVYEDKLFAISDVERVIREGKKKVISVNGQAFLDSSHLCVLKKYTYWGKLMLLSKDACYGTVTNY